MNILHVYRTYYPDTYGGVEQSIRQIALATTRLGTTNRIAHSGNFPAFRNHEFPEGRSYAYPQDFELASNTVSFKMLMAFPQLAAWSDLIHYHFPWPFGDLLQCLAASNKPYLVTYHSDIVRQRALLYAYWPLMRRFLSSAKVIVATSPNYFASSPVLGRYHATTRVIQTGLDEACYPAADPARIAHWRGRFGADFFLFVGMLRYYKGLHILLEAACGLDAPIVIIGAGPIEKELKARARSKGLKQVHFLGFQTDQDKAALLQLARAVVFPSYLRSEAFGLSLLEGAMRGKPLISCEIGTGTSFINVDGLTGIVTPPNDAHALREAMQRIHRDDALAEAYGKAARQRYATLFRHEQMAAKYLAAYRDAMNY
jgi:glycosyltransferase involved in cell wall biosynthesis